jgi:hypothetical protein
MLARPRLAGFSVARYHCGCAKEAMICAHWSELMADGSSESDPTVFASKARRCSDGALLTDSSLAQSIFTLQPLQRCPGAAIHLSRSRNKPESSRQHRRAHTFQPASGIAAVEVARIHSGYQDLVPG